jgi:hypothetical protein
MHALPRATGPRRVVRAIVAGLVAWGGIGCADGVVPGPRSYLVEYRIEFDTLLRGDSLRFRDGGTSLQTVVAPDNHWATFFSAQSGGPVEMTLWATASAPGKATVEVQAGAGTFTRKYTATDSALGAGPLVVTLPLRHLP